MKLLLSLVCAVLLVVGVGCEPKFWKYDIVDERFKADDKWTGIYSLDMQGVRLKLRIFSLYGSDIQVNLEIENRSRASVTYDPSQIHVAKNGRPTVDERRIDYATDTLLVDTSLITPKKRCRITYKAAIPDTGDVPPPDLELTIGDICVRSDDAPGILHAGQVQLKLRDY